MKLKRILFVDDEQSILDGLQDILRRHRREWDMVFSRGGELALVQLAEAPFDVVVSDMRMPGMDGAELLRRVQEQYPNVARIVLSGHADRDAVLRALPVAHQYLSKPCDAVLLRTVIEQTCQLQALLHNDAIRAAAGKLDKLPSVPHCYLELTKAVTTPGLGLADVATIVERDPAMSAKILQLVNSAYFGAGRQVTSVQRAVVYLGIELIQGLVLSDQVFDTLKETPVQSAFSLDLLQEHSLLTARLAKRFVSDPARAEEAFATGIVHDIGQIVLALGFPDRYADVLATAAREQRRTHHVEEEMLGITHAEAGAYLLGVWGLPHSIVETIAYHHTPALLASGSTEILGAIHVADAFVYALTIGQGDLDQADLVDIAFLERVNLASRLTEWKALAKTDLAGFGAASSRSVLHS